MEPIRRPVRIGFLVPPGNPTVEVEMIALAPSVPGIPLQGIKPPPFT